MLLLGGFTFALYGKNLIDSATAGFEAGSTPFKDVNDAGVMPLKANEGLPPGWTTTGNGDPAANWHLDGKGFPHVLNAKAGRHFVDLTANYSHDGEGHYFGAVTLNQPINLLAGQLYEFALHIGTYENDRAWCGPVKVTADFGDGHSKTFVTPRKENAGMLWTRHRYVFRAGNSPIRLTIRGVSALAERDQAKVDDDCNLIGIDEVSLRVLTLLGQMVEFFTTALRMLWSAVKGRPAPNTPFIRS